MLHQDAKTLRGDGTDKAEVLATITVDAAIEVHRHLGPGLSEAIYEESLAHELGLRGVGCAREQQVPVFYKGQAVGFGRLDLVVGGRVVVELKAIEALLPVHKAQVISYLAMTDLEIGFLINFNVPLLKQGIQRFINAKTLASSRLGAKG